MADRWIRMGGLGLALLAMGASPVAQMTGWGGTFPRLTSEDLERMRQAARAGLDGAPQGTRRAWENPRSKAHGEVELLRSFKRGGQDCRLVLHELALPGQQRWAFRVTLCRAPDGQWKVLEREQPQREPSELDDPPAATQ